MRISDDLTGKRIRLMTVDGNRHEGVVVGQTTASLHVTQGPRFYRNFPFHKIKKLDIAAVAK